MSLVREARRLSLVGEARRPGLAPVERLVVSYVPAPGRAQVVGRLARKERDVLFEYDAGFLETGLDLSPFRLPRRPGVVVGDPAVFDGLMGLFDDSLPDGWGRLLLDRRLAELGVRPAEVGPLDRLAWVGSGGMGALAYAPERGLETPTVVDLVREAAQAEEVLAGRPAELERLIALGGSPQGALPKALVQLGPDGETLLLGAGPILPGFTPYLVKFRARRDEAHAGRLELAYARMASAAGITMPETRLLGDHFAARRFDRDGARRLHVHTVSGLLHAPHTQASLSYRDLLVLTRKLTRDERAVEEIFRRACFNVFAHNRDDHTKNFALLMEDDGAWRLAPAYDLTFSTGPGGEHTMLVGTEGRDPGAAHLEALATSVGLERPRAIVEAVREVVRGFRAFAEEAGVPRAARQRVAKALAG